MERGKLSVKDLEKLVDEGEIDTVLCMFTDLQGRYMGKRILPHFFLEEVLADEGLHACLYLLAIAMVICDIADEETDEPVEVAPRQILKRQVERAKQAGYTVMGGSELEFYLFKESFDDAADKRYQDLHPTSTYIMDYHMLQTTKDEWLIRQIRNGMNDAGVPVEFSKGEFGKGQHEINLVYADALETADRHALYKHGAKDIDALNNVALTVIAKWTMAEAGSSCHVHSSLWTEDGSDSLMWDEAD